MMISYTNEKVKKCILLILNFSLRFFLRFYKIPDEKGPNFQNTHFLHRLLDFKIL